MVTMIVPAGGATSRDDDCSRRRGDIANGPAGHLGAVADTGPDRDGIAGQLGHALRAGGQLLAVSDDHFARGEDPDGMVSGVCDGYPGLGCGVERLDGDIDGSALLEARSGDVDESADQCVRITTTLRLVDRLALTQRVPSS
jgi:hypothetical protein